MYVRGHLRRYAELIGESPGELLDLYVALHGPRRPDLTRIPRGGACAAVSALRCCRHCSASCHLRSQDLWWPLTLPHASLTRSPRPPPPRHRRRQHQPGLPPRRRRLAAAPAAPVRAAGGRCARGRPEPHATVLRTELGAGGGCARQGAARWAADCRRGALGERRATAARGARQCHGGEARSRPARLFEGLVRRRGDAHVSVEGRWQVPATPRAGAETSVVAGKSRRSAA